MFINQYNANVRHILYTAVIHVCCSDFQCGWHDCQKRFIADKYDEKMTKWSSKTAGLRFVFSPRAPSLHGAERVNKANTFCTALFFKFSCSSENLN